MGVRGSLSGRLAPEYNEALIGVNPLNPCKQAFEQGWVVQVAIGNHQQIAMRLVFHF